MANTWEKRVTETPASYEKFQNFLSLEPTTRTLAKAAATCHCSETSIKELARVHKWIDRASAHDDYYRKSAIAPTFNQRLAKQREYLEASRDIGGDLLRMGLEALKALENSEEPLPVGVALRAIEVGHKLYGTGVGADQPKSDVESALAVLVDAGYLEDDVVEAIAQTLDEGRQKTKALLAGRTDEDEQTLLEMIDHE